MADEESVSEAFELLCAKDNRVACRALQELQRISAETNLVYPYMDRLSGMLDSGNSYICTRAFTLVACSTKWDKGCKIDEVIGSYPGYITDAKPITAGQCIKALPLIARENPR